MALSEYERPTDRAQITEEMIDAALFSIARRLAAGQAI